MTTETQLNRGETTLSVSEAKKVIGEIDNHVFSYVYQDGEVSIPTWPETN